VFVRRGGGEGRGGGGGGGRRDGGEEEGRDWRRAREVLCAMMTFPLWDRFGSPRSSNIQPERIQEAPWVTSQR